MAELTVDLAGFKLRHPFLLASGSPAGTGEMLGRAFQAGWAGP
jgi:dihydroorotate dehydrogenase